MGKLGRLDPEALGPLELEALVAGEPEIVFAVALASLLSRFWRPHLTRLVVHANSAPRLTCREIEVLAWVAQGKTNAQAAELLTIAPGTVKKHLDRIYEKLGVGTRTEAVVTAMGIWHGDDFEPAKPEAGDGDSGAVGGVH